MIREQAIKWVKFVHDVLYEDKDEEIREALNMAIEALSAEPNKAVPPSLADVYKWERDIALAQLEEYGICFAEKKRDDLVEVVRCKDCKHRFVDGENVKYNCCELNHNKYMADEWHCADGERREP